MHKSAKTEGSALKTGIIYCRVSSTEQVENTSLESQEKYCRDYAKRNNIKIVRVFVEKGESAKTADRTEFTKAINFCGENKKVIDFFIVHKLDRFARNQTDHVTMQAILRKYNVSLRSATEPINETSMGRLMEGVLSSFAEFDNNVRTERSKGGMLEKLKQGVWVWQAPIGFYRPYKGSNIAPDKDLAPFIELAFTEWRKGTYSYKSLAKYLSERGFRTKTGKKVYTQAMEKIIKNPIYCGVMRAFGEEFEGRYEPIISKELWHECQSGPRRNKRSSRKSKYTHQFPLRRFCKCDECKQSLTASISKGNGGKYAYYHHQTQGCSKARSIPVEEFEQLFIQFLDRITPSKKYEKVFKAIMIDIWKKNYKKFSENSRKITREIESLEQERTKIFDLHRSQIYSDEEFLEQKRVINEKIYHKRQLLQDNYIEEFDMEEALNYCFRFVGESAKVWERMKKARPEQLMRFQKQIFPENITFDGEKFGTKKVSLIYKLNKEFGDDNDNLVTLRGFEPLFHP